MGYPDFKAGDATEQAGGGAVVIKTDYGGLAGWLVGGSGAWQYQYCPADDLALGVSIAAELLDWRGSTYQAG